jgi:hypothetical protein
MKNVKMTINGDILTIEVDLKQDQGKSSSGKSIVIATTEGNKTVKDDIKIGLNIYKPVKE